MTSLADLAKRLPRGVKPPPGVPLTHASRKAEVAERLTHARLDRDMRRRGTGPFQPFERVNNPNSTRKAQQREILGQHRKTVANNPYLKEGLFPSSPITPTTPGPAARAIREEVNRVTRRPVTIINRDRANMGHAEAAAATSGSARAPRMIFHPSHQADKVPTKREKRFYAHEAAHIAPRKRTFHRMAQMQGDKYKLAGEEARADAYSYKRYGRPYKAQHQYEEMARAQQRQKSWNPLLRFDPKNKFILRESAKPERGGYGPKDIERYREVRRLAGSPVRDYEAWTKNAATVGGVGAAGGLGAAAYKQNQREQQQARSRVRKRMMGSYHPNVRFDDKDVLPRHVGASDKHISEGAAKSARESSAKAHAHQRQFGRDASLAGGLGTGGLGAALLASRGKGGKKMAGLAGALGASSAFTGYNAYKHHKANQAYGGVADRIYDKGRQRMEDVGKSLDYGVFTGYERPVRFDGWGQSMMANDGVGHSFDDYEDDEDIAKGVFRYLGRGAKEGGKQYAQSGPFRAGFGTGIATTVGAGAGIGGTLALRKKKQAQNPMIDYGKRDTSRMSPEELQARREKVAGRVAATSNIVGLAAGVGGISAAMKHPGFSESKRPGMKRVSETGEKIGRLMPKKARQFVARHPGKLALGGLALQGGNIVGDTVTNRVLARANAEKEKPPPQAPTKYLRHEVPKGTVLPKKSDYTLAKGERTVDAEMDRQRRLGLLAGTGVGTSLVAGNYGRKAFERMPDPKTGKHVGLRIAAHNPKRKLAALGLAGASGLGGLAAYKHGINERNLSWR